MGWGDVTLVGFRTAMKHLSVSTNTISERPILNVGGTIPRRMEVEHQHSPLSAACCGCHVTAASPWQSGSREKTGRGPGTEPQGPPPLPAPCSYAQRLWKLPNQCHQLDIKYLKPRACGGTFYVQTVVEGGGVVCLNCPFHSTHARLLLSFSLPAPGCFASSLCPLGSNLRLH